ncbi:hypothetical protein NSMM_350025 [Nitrosomonas mobilis]|uniref:Uncharacterized protein n=1 Tax=Nitrosomonas mobilis TaxID=51642 RepID=A0A1G5SF36_9PROT|nr:hypothetical protein NSMM_350025 [Nitrosomonas mobilis]
MTLQFSHLLTRNPAFSKVAEVVHKSILIHLLANTPHHTQSPHETSLDAGFSTAKP